MWRDWDFHLIHFLYYPFEYPWVWLPVAFWLGAMSGSFLNVCLGRLPRGQSLWWPGSHCLSCYQPIRGWDNIPLVSYWLLRGRCRSCGQRFSMGYFWVELAVAAMFAGLWLYDVAWNVPGLGQSPARFAVRVRGSELAWCWAWHAVLAWVLLAVVLLDAAGERLPQPLLLFGTAVGLAGGAWGAWPWPAVLPARPEGLLDLAPAQLPRGLQLAPLWRPLPELLPPGSAALGLTIAGAGAGLACGAVLLWSWAGHRLLGREPWQAGEVHTAAMLGSFLGWQPMLLALAGTFLGLALGGLADRLRGHRRARPRRGLTLAASAVLVLLAWPGLLRWGLVWGV
jgi:leader peptidase (prepilin peptidase)/N-methyltransferase